MCPGKNFVRLLLVGVLIPELIANSSAQIESSQEDVDLEVARVDRGCPFFR